MVKAKRIKELEKKYEAVSLILGPKDKSGLRICSVPEKIKGISEVASGTPYSKKMAFKQGQKPPNPRVKTRKGACMHGAAVIQNQLKQVFQLFPLLKEAESFSSCHILDWAVMNLQKPQ